LSPVLGLLTLAILLFGKEAAPSSVSRRRVTRLAGLAVIAPVWLIVMYFAVAVFNR
jgi:hypothetical protein